MKKYELLILPRALKELLSIPTKKREKINKAILKLEHQPRGGGGIKLAGRDAWRIRVGEYRVVYEVSDSESQVVVMHVGHRKDVYR